MAQVANVTGRTFVRAIIEPNGHVSDVSLIKGFRPDCDQEALRVMRLFNAWKPAIKGGVAVRQGITYPVVFKSNTPISYLAGQRIDYFNDNDKPTTSREAASVQQTHLIDTLTGLPLGDLVVSAIRGNKTRETQRLPIVRTENKPLLPGKLATVTLGHQQKNGAWHGPVYTVDADGHVLKIHYPATFYTATYNEDGLVIQLKNYDETRSQLSWYGNGQLRSVEAHNEQTGTSTSHDEYRLMAAWDSTGHTQVAAGTGLVQHESIVISRADANRAVTFVESGRYVDGFKDGAWTGKYSDGSYSYEESFATGKPLGGKAIINGGTPITYVATEQNPEFKKGQEGMYIFLAQTIRYPAEAVKTQIQGKVFVSFTICTDGSLCDYEILKGVDPSIDQEALRVVKKMSGQWQPGYQRGEPVRVKYNLPISFQFQ